jgi:hypothetical protein
METNKSSFKRVLLLFRIGVVLLAGLIFTSNTKVSTAHANGCNTVAEGYGGSSTGLYFIAKWANTCTVQKGDTSNAVYAIQLTINESGYSDPQTGKPCTVGNVDGVFGQNTFNGVECFQRAYNALCLPICSIGVDGIVGHDTWNVLGFVVTSVSSTLTTGWNYFYAGNPNIDDYRMWGQSPYKWYVDAGGCWRQIDVNSDSCS